MEDTARGPARHPGRAAGDSRGTNMRICGLLCTVLFAVLAAGPALAVPEYAVVTGSGGGAGAAYLISVDGSSLDIVSSVSVGSDLRGVAAYGDRAYVADYANDKLHVLRMSSSGSTFLLESLTSVGTGSGPTDVAVGDAYAYVANSYQGNLSRIDTSTYAVNSVNSSPVVSPQSLAMYDAIDHNLVVGAQNATGVGRIARVSGTTWGQLDTTDVGFDFGYPRQVAVGWTGTVARSYLAAWWAGTGSGSGGIVVMDPATGKAVGNASSLTSGFMPTGVSVLGSGPSWSLAVAGYDSSNDAYLRRYALDANGAVSNTPSASYSLGSGMVHRIARSASGNYLFVTSSDGQTLVNVFDVSGTSWTLVGSVSAGGVYGWGVTAIGESGVVPEPSSLAALCVGLGGMLSALRRLRRK